MELLSERTRSLAGRVAGIADTVRDVGTRSAGVGTLDWQGTTATGFRARLQALDRSTTVLASACDDTAGRLAVHAGNVADAERRITDLVRAAA